MEHRFDRLAKSVAGAMTRRQALWRVGGGLAASVLAILGLGSASPGDCARCCIQACLTLNPPPRGQEMADCIRTCFETGFVAGQEVCPSSECNPTS